MKRQGRPKEITNAVLWLCSDDAASDSLKIICELVRRLIQLHVIRAGHDHHDHATVLAVFDRAAELRAFRRQLIHRRIDVIAHERDRVLPRVMISLAYPYAVRRVHTHLARH
jgi:hypothetical protein